MTSIQGTAEFPQSWLGRLARRIPGVLRLLRDRDAASRAQATAQLRIAVKAGHEISVRAANTGDRPIDARIVVEGTLD